VDGFAWRVQRVGLPAYDALAESNLPVYQKAKLLADQCMHLSISFLKLEQAASPNSRQPILNSDRLSDRRALQISELRGLYNFDPLRKSEAVGPICFRPPEPPFAAAVKSRGNLFSSSTIDYD